MICYRCHTERPADAFCKNKNLCKECKRTESRIYRERYPERYREASRKGTAKWRANNPEKANAWQKNNPEKRRIIEKRFRQKHTESVRETGRRWRDENPEKVREYGLRSSRKFHRTHKDDPKYRLRVSMKRDMARSLKAAGGSKAGRKWVDLVPYDFSDLRSHLERNFDNGMTWYNYGEWHIDHKIPISAHNFTDPTHEDFQRCWALENLQPMWALGNIKKSNKLDKPFQPSLAM